MTPVRSRFTASARPRLATLLDGVLVGWVYESANHRLGFRYEAGWQSDSTSYPLSVSLPTIINEHGHRVTSAYLWGLLPENPEVLERWARLYEVSRYDVVDLLAHVGEDCAGAVQFALPDRVDSLLGAGTVADQTSEIRWLTDEELEERLRTLRLDPAAGYGGPQTGHFSLAGVQGKLALYELDETRRGVPSGRIPTNLIVKPPIRDLPDVVQNEFFCLELARALGFSAASSRILRVGTEIAIAVKRYDRMDRAGMLRRIHQEDLCQAVAIQPTKKYEWNGGPGIERAIRVLNDVSNDPERDIRRFLDAALFNWIIAGTDGHAKNYSLLHEHGPQARLAPLYDLISALPYPHLENGEPSLAMAVGGERRISAIGREHWSKLARDVGVKSTDLLDRARQLIVAIPAALDSVLDTHTLEALDSKIIHRLAKLLRERSTVCASILNRQTANRG